jgi:hypothetical protein
MYIQINQEKIKIDFNSGITVSISGPDDFYYVEVNEFQKNNDNLVYVEGYLITDKLKYTWMKKNFTLPIEFYFNFQIKIYKFIDKIGLKPIFTHQYNDNDKLVLFKLDTNDYNEALLWTDRILQYKKINQCKIVLESQYETLNKSFDSFYQTKNLDFYKTYKVGRYPKTSTDWRTVDPRKEGVIWFGNWKTFWSYQHPRFWGNISSQEIIDDILGI